MAAVQDSVPLGKTDGSTIPSGGPSIELVEKEGTTSLLAAERKSLEVSVPTGTPESGEKQAVGTAPAAARPAAEQVPIPCGMNRYVLAGFFCVVVLLKGCTYWGWNGMQEMMYKSGVYEWECGPDSAGAGVLRVGNVDYPDCAARKNMINNLYTATFSAHFISSAASGVLLDAAGPKICMLAALAIEAAGWLLIGFSSQSFQGYYAGGVFLGVAADPGYLPLLSVANLFRGNESFLMAVLGSLRSISFAVPVILSAIFQSESFAPDDFWKIIVMYVAIGLGLSTIVTLFLVPMSPFKPRSELEDAAVAGEASSREDAPQRCASYTGGEEAAQRPAVAERAEGPRSFVAALKSKEFLLIVPCFVIALLRAEFYTKSNKEQLQVSSSSNVYQMFSVLNIMSFLPGPVFGKMTDKFGILPVIATLNTFGIFLYVFVMPNVLACKAISTLLYFVYCSFVLSNLYCYVAINFPSEYFGKLTGLASLIGGVFSLTSIGWYKLSSETLLDMAPYNFLPADGIMVFFGLVNCVIILAMFRQDKAKKVLTKENPYLDVSGKNVQGAEGDAEAAEAAV
ncbi:transporter, major facilitator family protein [Besnoitia besnoiti]|uniref:Transporter, major facilitator family protein n=1 Tax=Besnoitia besnoiti TaxID=94643 RepID=A0A2A9MG98_BESBE|nr:transporter, major facilitator family protein [Besnoitia besnoiti]PFH36194.1 transporter, major facilitator family protein [Besnoitia besnoiti]